MPHAFATIATEDASRYLQQLSKHWSHRFTVAFDAHCSEIDFGDGRKLMLEAYESELRMTLTGSDAAGLTQLEGVVAEHLQRFAFREPLTIMWQKRS